MKRVVAFIILFSLLLALCACGGTPSETGEPSETSESGQGSQPSKENPSGDTDKTSTLMSVATELANKVDDMPLYGDVLVSVFSSFESESAALPTRENVFFYRDEGSELDGVYLHENYLPDDFDPSVEGNQYERNHHRVESFNIDNIVKGWRELKNLALLSCKELDVWVGRNPSTEIPIPSGLTPSHSNYRYRIHYDVNRDFVTVEELVDGHAGFDNTYRCYTLGYTPDNKLKVDGFTASFDTSASDDMAFNSLSSVHYLEGSYYMAVSDASGESEVTVLNIETEQWAKMYPIYEYEEIDGVSVPKMSEMDYYLSFERNGYLVEMSKDTEALYLPDGRYGAQWDGLNDFYLSLDIFDGWRQVESSGDNALLTLTTEKEAFFFHTTTHEDFDFLNRETFFFNLSYQNGGWPMIWLKRGNSMAQQGVDWTTADAKESLAALEDILGITVKQEIRELLFSLREEHSARENGFCFPFEGKTGCLLSVEEYTALVNELAYADVTAESILEKANSEILPFDEQNPEYEYFEFLNFTVSGGASFEETTASLDLSAVTATLSPSVLLNRGATYQLVFLFVSNDGRAMVGSKEGVYNGDTLIISGELRIPREGIPFSDEEYTLQCYFADEQDNRISEIQTVKGEHSGEYDLSTESRGQTLTVTPDKITAKNYPLPTEE